MRPLEWSSLTFFAYAAVVARTVRRPSVQRRLSALGGAALGILLVAVSAKLPLHPVLQIWIFPPALLLTAYWTSGLLFVRPMPKVERVLITIDDRLRIRCLASRAPRWVAELLELAYIGVYAVVATALALQFVFFAQPDADRFWTVILTTDYICFGALPWIQTRPPRALEARDPWESTFRRINLRLLGAASVQANTFPSGHAAEALAAALLVLDAPWPIVIGMFVSALAISAGAVLGRYHYAADAIAGWIVASAVWALTM